MNTDKTNTALLWATWLAVGYADDNCFALCETDEWEHMYEALGLPKNATNRVIEAEIQSRIEALGFRRSALRGVWIKQSAPSA